LMNRRMRTRMSGGVRGRRLAAAFLLDYRCDPYFMTDLS
jgi:hypothetical protein